MGPIWTSEFEQFQRKVKFRAKLFKEEGNEKSVSRVLVQETHKTSKTFKVDGKVRTLKLRFGDPIHRVFPQEIPTAEMAASKDASEIPSSSVQVPERGTMPVEAVRYSPVGDTSLLSYLRDPVVWE
ncbi:hypothetical protein TNCV_455731 [Trichonephila clavipes]|nr:hypothetical protein TNCV_455731 [Trichonephila clavipes]